MSDDRIIGTALLISGPGTDYEWLWYVYVGKNITGVSWDELPLLREGLTQPAEKLPQHFKDQRPWRYTEQGGVLTVSPSVNKSNGWWHNQGQWTVKFVRATMPHNVAGRHKFILETLIAQNPGEQFARLREFYDKIHGSGPHFGDDASPDNLQS